MTTTSTMHDYEMIMDALVELLKAEKAVDAAEKEVIEARYLLAESSPGYKRTIAQARMRDAVAAKEAATEAHNAIVDRLPEADSVPLAWSCRQVAEYRIRREELTEQLAVANKALEDAKEKSSKGTWKRAAERGNSPQIAAAKEKIAAIESSIDALDATHGPTKKGLEEYIEIGRNIADMNRWYDGDHSGPKPVYVQEIEMRQQLEMEEWMADAIVLPLPKPRLRHIASGSMHFFVR